MNLSQIHPGVHESYYIEAKDIYGDHLLFRVETGYRAEAFFIARGEIPQERLTDEELQNLAIRLRDERKWKQIVAVFREVTERTVVLPHCEKCGNTGENVFCGYCEEGAKHSSCDDTYRKPCDCPAGRGKKGVTL